MGSAGEPVGQGTVTFARPDLLPLALALPAFVALAIWGYARRRRRVARALGERDLIGRLGAGDLFAFPTARLALVCGAAAALGAAAAGPRWGVREREGQTASLSAVLALDISKSMLAEDVAPDRLERERLLARRILRELPGDRFGMVVFAGRAYVLSPMTVDHSALQLYLDALDPEVVSQGGSSLAAALAQATDLARGAEETTADRAVVLVTDGEALEEESNVLAAAERAAQLGVVVHTVGIGTTRGSPIPERNPRTGEITGYKRDETGEIVVSRLNESLLREIASRTGGRYFNLDEARATERLVGALEGLQRTAGASGRQVEMRERFALFVAIALLLLAADALIARRAARPTTDRPRTTATLGRAANVALVIMALTLTGFGVGDVERGNRLYREGRYAEAVEAYRSALRDGEDSPALQYNLGTALLRIGRYAEAERHLQASLDGVDPTLRHRSLYNLGNRYLEAARAQADPAAQSRLLDAAVEAYRRSLRVQPSDAEAKWNLEMALRDQEDNPPQPQAGQNQDEQQQQQEDQEQGPGSGGGSAGSPPPSSGSSDRSDDPQAGMTEEQADRILSAVEQDERQLTRENLRKGQRRTPVLRDW
jgi:Ca-activated chloride channel family protein